MFQVPLPKAVSAFALAATLLSMAFVTGCSNGGAGANVTPQTASVLPGAAISKYSVIYAFQGGSDGALPLAALTKLNRKLYGTTSQGGGATQCAAGCGTVFRIDQSLDVAVLYRFSGIEGANPDAGLVASNGLLIGTTQTTSSSCPLYTPYSSHTSQLGSCGTIFSITPSGQWTLLFNFQNNSPQFGAYPHGITIVGNVLFGTTTNGGAGGDCASYFSGILQYPLFNGCGVAFSLAKNETILHGFGGGTDASMPASGLTPFSGNLYGTSLYGGSGKCQPYPRYYLYSATGCGTVYVLSPSGSEHLVHQFAGDEDGKYPYSGLTVNVGRLYGTTSAGGSGCTHLEFGCGTVFEVTPSGAERVVYAFKGVPDGASPRGALTFVKGKFYGTTMLGGSSGCHCGTIFSVTRAGQERVVHTFTGKRDGAYPESSLTYFRGRLYGTTSQGGGSKACSQGCGTVFAFTP